MQIVENRADVNVKVLDSCPGKTVDGFVTLEDKVSEVEDVEGFRNLPDDRRGEVVCLNVPEAVRREVSPGPGAKISCRVRAAGKMNLFAHPERVRVV